MIVLQASKQYYFNKICRHLAKQKRRAMDGKNCAYRTKEGLMCAIGCLLPKGEYDPDMEGCRVPVLVRSFGLKTPESYMDFWKDIQDAHDMGTDLKILQNRLIGVAATYELNAKLVQLIKEWNG